MASKIVLWTYVALLVAGGLIGYLKAGSVVSIITSVAFAIPIALCALGILPSWVADALVGVLIAFFVYRLVKTQKFMPAGMMAALSVVVLLLRLLVLKR